MWQLGTFPSQTRPEIWMKTFLSEQLAACDSSIFFKKSFGLLMQDDAQDNWETNCRQGKGHTEWPLSTEQIQKQGQESKKHTMGKFIHQEKDTLSRATWHREPFWVSAYNAEGHFPGRLFLVDPCLFMAAPLKATSWSGFLRGSFSKELPSASQSARGAAGFK